MHNSMHNFIVYKIQGSYRPLASRKGRHPCPSPYRGLTRAVAQESPHVTSGSTGARIEHLGATADPRNRPEASLWLGSGWLQLWAHSRLARLHSSRDPRAARRAAGGPRESAVCTSCFPWAASRLRAASARQISWPTHQNQPQDPPGGAASAAGVPYSATATAFGAKKGESESSL